MTTQTPTVTATEAPRPLALAEIGQHKAEAYHQTRLAWDAFSAVIDGRETYTSETAYREALDVAEDLARDAEEVYTSWCIVEDNAKTAALWRLAHQGETDSECHCVLDSQDCPACRAAAARVGQPDPTWRKISIETEF